VDPLLSVVVVVVFGVVVVVLGGVGVGEFVGGGVVVFPPSVGGVVLGLGVPESPNGEETLGGGSEA